MYTVLDRLPGPLLGSQRRCHADALSPALIIIISSCSQGGEGERGKKRGDRVPSVHRGNAPSQKCLPGVWYFVTYILYLGGVFYTLEPAFGIYDKYLVFRCINLEFEMCSEYSKELLPLNNAFQVFCIMSM